MRQPASRVLSDKIPRLLIGRNSRGFWVVREAEGRTGGIFIFRRSALHFATRAGAPMGYTTMLLGRPLELDVENRGNPAAAWLDRALRSIAEKYHSRNPPQPRQFALLMVGLIALLVLLYVQIIW
jgi:hypothetical protein